MAYNTFKQRNDEQSKDVAVFLVHPVYRYIAKMVCDISYIDIYMYIQ
jgi:methyl coenzyme M reductase subunit C